MPVANLADISPHLTYDNTVEFLTEAYDNRMNIGKVGVLYTYYIYILLMLQKYSVSASTVHL